MTKPVLPYAVGQVWMSVRGYPHEVLEVCPSGRARCRERALEQTTRKLLTGYASVCTDYWYSPYGRCEASDVQLKELWQVPALNHVQVSVTVGEPPCRCKFVRLGHDNDCAYVAWRNRLKEEV